jgi:hypothetical protein
MRLSPTFPVAALAVLAACGGAGPSPESPGSSPGPALTVERFLQAANTNDWSTMSRLFGTSDKTIDELDGSSQAQRRMQLLSSLLRHDDFAFRGQRQVPGRLQDATELMVQLRQGTRQVDVPFRVVRRKGGGWIIEWIDTVQLARR